MIDESDDVSFDKYDTNEVEKYNELRGSILTDTEMSPMPTTKAHEANPSTQSPRAFKVIDETDKISEKSHEGETTEFVDSARNTSELKTQASTLPDKQETFEQTFANFQKIMSEDLTKWK